MVGETECGAASDATNHVQIGNFGGEGERKRGQRGLAVESSASHAGAGQEVGDGFQESEGFYSDAAKCATCEGLSVVEQARLEHRAQP